MGAPAEKFLMVDFLVQAMSADIRERGRDTGGGNWNADTEVKLREFFDVHQNYKRMILIVACFRGYFLLCKRERSYPVILAERRYIST